MRVDYMLEVRWVVIGVILIFRDIDLARNSFESSGSFSFLLRQRLGTRESGLSEVSLEEQEKNLLKKLMVNFEYNKNYTVSHIYC